MRQTTKALAIAGIAAAGAYASTAAAGVYVSIGVPGVVFAAPEVVYAPPVYGPPPAYCPRRLAFNPVYAYGAPWGERWHEWHEREEWREHHGRPAWRGPGGWYEHGPDRDDDWRRHHW